MAQADRHSGKGVHLAYTPDGGSAIDLDVDYRNFSWSQSLNEIDATAGDDDWEYFVNSFSRGEVTISILAGASSTYLVPGSFGSLVYGPKGSASTNREVTLPVKLMSVDEVQGYADVATLDLTFRQTGAAAVDTF